MPKSVTCGGCDAEEEMEPIIVQNVYTWTLPNGWQEDFMETYLCPDCVAELKDDDEATE